MIPRSFGKAEPALFGLNAEGGVTANNVAVLHIAVFENAIGTADGDVVIGNAWNHDTQCGAGNDLLQGWQARNEGSVVGDFYDDAAGYDTGAGENSSASRDAGVASNHSGDSTLGGDSGADALLRDNCKRTWHSVQRRRETFAHGIISFSRIMKY